MGAQDRILRVILYDKNWVRQGFIGNPVSVTATQRFLAQDSGELTVRATDTLLPEMMKPGARVRILLDEQGDIARTYFAEAGGNLILSGPLRDPAGSFLPGGTVTFQIDGDWRLLRNTVARVIPATALSAASLSDPGQSYDPGVPPAVGADTARVGYFPWPTGPVTASQATATLMDQINDRYFAKFGERPLLTYSGIASADVSSVLPQVRFGTIEDYVVPLLRFAGDGIRIEMLPREDQLVQKFQANYWTPKVWPEVFTPDSGVVRDGKWTMKYPQATDIVLGGPGENSARAFYGVADSTGLSALHHDIVEVFRDATGAPVEWPSSLADELQVAKYYLLRPEVTADQKAAFLTFLNNAGADALTDGQPTSGVSLTLAESEGFRFTGIAVGGDADGFATGDWVTVAPSKDTALSGLQFTEQITQVTLALSKDGGLTVTPQLGEISDDPDLNLAKAITSLASANNRQATSR